MTIFYIDTEFNEGNLYLGDIFEIACLSSSSNRIFHSYINIPTNVSRYVQKLCALDLSLLRKSPSFNEVMDNLIVFITEEEDSNTQTILMGHGARLSDYPLIITNCMKNYYDHSIFNQYKFIDSMEGFRESGYQRPGLSTLSTSQRNIHSAKEDIQLLRDIVTSHSTIQYKLFTYEDILNHINEKMPLTIFEVRKVAKCYQDLEQYLQKYMKKKSALNKKQLMKIVNRYYYDCICN